ncbi:MAG TPA: M15 family metallopeptidase [Candidatus Merdisoma merdipullorum]|nr:M15 family metallopeptidase [Candidatus Merdisoma merdipullorum]
MTRRQKKRMLALAGSLTSIICVGMLIGTVYAQTLEQEQQEEAVVQEIVLPDVLEEETKQSTEELNAEDEYEENLPDDWNLILVNRTHPIPEDYEVELKPIGSGHQIDARAYDDFRAMIQAAKSEGIYIYVTSSYRDLDKQTDLYNKKVESYVMQGYSYENAKEQAGQVVAVPGTSEHHLGLALDFVSSEYRKLDEKQENTKGFQWLEEHSWEYGFILRYPNGETDITGIIYEPWHFRYVGLEAAKEITESGLTLEEYLGAEPVSEGLARMEEQEDLESRQKETGGRYTYDTEEE